MPAIVLLAKPRAGAHGFNSIVRTHPQISVFAEIFHDALVEQEQNFFGFVWKEAERMKQFCMPYHHSRLKIFGEYLEYLETRSKTPRFIIDIKYNEHDPKESVFGFEIFRPVETLGGTALAFFLVAMVLLLLERMLAATTTTETENLPY